MEGTEQFRQADDLCLLAGEIIQNIESVGHVDINDVLFLWDQTTFKGNVLGMCFKLIGHPAQFFTKKKWCIVVYENRVGYMSLNQLKVLLYHELKHIPPFGDKLVKHNVKDFITILDIDYRWSDPGREIPDIIKTGGASGKKD